MLAKCPKCGNAVGVLDRFLSDGAGDHPAIAKPERGRAMPDCPICDKCFTCEGSGIVTVGNKDGPCSTCAGSGVRPDSRAALLDALELTLPLVSTLGEATTIPESAWVLGRDAIRSALAAAREGERDAD